MVWLVLAVAVTLGVMSASASAEVRRSFESSFNGTGAPGAPFATPISVAVDDSSGPSGGDVYVAEGNLGTGVATVQKFHANGTYAGVEITGAETPQKAFSVTLLSSFLLSGIAVDSSSGANRGDVYVADVEQGHDVVDRFSESGVFQCQISGASVPSSRECNSGGSATAAGSLVPSGVAVDSAGDVYVSDSEHSLVVEFGPTGALIREITAAEITSPRALTVDSAGNIYVENASTNVVELDPAGQFVRVLDAHASVGLATDPSNGHIVVAGGHVPAQLFEYSSAGTLLGVYGEGELAAQAFTLAIGAGGQLYAAPLAFSEGVVDRFSSMHVIPNTFTESATGVGQTTAQLQARVDPDVGDGGGSITECVFEYGETTTYGQVVPCSPSTPYGAVEEVSGQAGGLSPDTAYHFRVKAENASGSNVGADETFTTRGPAVVASESAEATVTSAILSAEINPFGYETTCVVQYVDQQTFSVSGYADALSVPCEAPTTAGWGAQTASAPLDGLTTDTDYHFRFVASSQGGTVVGADSQFATFGIEAFAFAAVDGEGAPYVQAGGHPYELTDNLALNVTHHEVVPPEVRSKRTDANPKEIEVALPAGLVGNPDATPKCNPYDVAHAECSGATQVGVITVYTSKNQSPTTEPVYNLVPPKGVAALFGARFNGFATAYIDAKVRTGGDYGVTADSLEISNAEGITNVELRMWGVPADASHDAERSCPGEGATTENPGCASGVPPVPFLTMPTSCSGAPLVVSMRMDSWQEPMTFVQAAAEMSGTTGCDRLDFSPTIAVEPETSSADSATGLVVDLKVPQNQNPTGLAEANLKDATVSLPPGVTLNPSAASGLEGCTPGEIELHGSNPATCPDASKLGSVEIITPLINHPLRGGVYAAQQGNAGAAQGSNPFGSLLAAYIAIDDPETGVVVKLAGQITLNEQTGQITTSFNENPQLPFEELKITLPGGPQAPFATPPACGAYRAETSLTPWSAPESGPAATPFGEFQIASGSGGTACASPGFAPSMMAGTEGNRAGSFSPLTLTLARHDGEQRLSTVETTMPPGVAGMLSKVTLCPEAQASMGACPEASKIGHVTISAGVGSAPITVPQPGKPQDPVYLTGPYEGAPFGLAVVVRAEAGPFNLDENGHPVVVRARVEVNPSTAQVTVASDPAPQMLQGVPVDIRMISVTIDRPEFTFNPTDCEALGVSGTVKSAQGATASVSTRFQAAECRSLAFQPTLTATTSAHTSKANGARLVVKMTYPHIPEGTEANIGKVKVDLPVQLPSRGSTLEKACVDRVFNANPASCPPASAVGTATVVTPVLKSPLTGPAYLVSHGGAAFPDLEMVLQGEGVTLILDSKTNIKHGVTSSSFRSVPDAPVSSFQLVLPQGRYSALAAYGSLCKGALLMPTEITGQNGAEIHRDTHIRVTGCAKVTKQRKKKPAKRRKG